MSTGSLRTVSSTYQVLIHDFYGIPGRPEPDSSPLFRRNETPIIRSRSARHDNENHRRNLSNRVRHLGVMRSVRPPRGFVDPHDRRKFGWLGSSGEPGAVGCVGRVLGGGALGADLGGGAAAHRRGGVRCRPWRRAARCRRRADVQLVPGPVSRYGVARAAVTNRLRAGAAERDTGTDR
jgi:hypothetical protein